MLCMLKDLGSLSGLTQRSVLGTYNFCSTCVYISVKVILINLLLAKLAIITLISIKF